jgi:hypothetical protein
MASAPHHSAPADTPPRPRPEDVYVAYHGWPRPDGTTAVVIEFPPGNYQPLPHLTRHSPAGFNCGYNGNGPRDLALSLLAHALDDPTVDRTALTRSHARCTETTPPLYQRFAEQVLTCLPRDRAWSLRREDILRWVSSEACSNARWTQHRPRPDLR